MKKVFTATLVAAMMLAGCASNSASIEKSPCACEYENLVSVQHNLG